MTAIEETNDNCSREARSAVKEKKRKERDAKKGWKAEIEGQRLQGAREDKL